jgi:hypothetical protein
MTLTTYDAHCPACGDPIDYCQGHGQIGDPEGNQILWQHDHGEHEDCHPAGCERLIELYTLEPDLATGTHPEYVLYVGAIMATATIVVLALMAV